MNIDILNNPTADFFAKNYEEKNIPCIIKNYPLDWPIFKMPDYHIAKKLNIGNFYRYLKRGCHYLLPDKDDVFYLKNYLIAKSALSGSYSIPHYFENAPFQPYDWKWLYWGPPSSSSKIHIDTTLSSAWNVVISGEKMWWFWFNNKTYHCIQTEKEIVFTPGNIEHAACNISSCLSITHNYLRDPEKIKWATHG
tara:strand:+ start:16 stop:597 length:582 start_codon:yes stop_codon:yes gene_type:complete